MYHMGGNAIQITSLFACLFTFIFLNPCSFSELVTGNMYLERIAQVNSASAFHQKFL